MHIARLALAVLLSTLSAATVIASSPSSSSSSSSSSSAASSNPAAVKRYEATGRITSFGAERAHVLIAHEAIPGFMGAMTMRFDAKTTTQLAGFAVGDDVVFAFTNDRGLRVIDTIAKRPAR